MFRPSLILLGLLIGLPLAIFYGWQVSPVNYANTEPASLRADYKEQYLLLMAAAYHVDHNLEHAQTRLTRLRYSDPVAEIAALAQRRVADGKDAAALAVLAADLKGGLPVAAATTTPVPVLPTHTATPTYLPTVTLASTLSTFLTSTPTPTPEYDYALILQEQYCNEQERLPLIIVDVVDATNAPLPSVRVRVQWPEGQDGFVTGLKPEISAGYGDFLMTVGATYSVQVGSRTPPISGLTPSTCLAAEAETYPGAVRLVFQRK